MNEWIEWEGGACPVPDGTHVDVRFADLREFLDQIACGSKLTNKSGSKAWRSYWQRYNIPADIVAYRLTD